MATASYLHMHKCATAKLQLESQRTAGTRHQERGAQRPRAALNYFTLYSTTILHYRTQETPGALEGTRGDQEGHQRDRGLLGGPKSQETPAGPEGTAGGSGETPRA